MPHWRESSTGIFNILQYKPLLLKGQNITFPRFHMLIEKNYAKQQVYTFLGLCPSPSMKGRFFLWMPCPNTCSFRCYDRSCGQTIQQRGEFWKNDTDTSSLSFHFGVSANSISHLLQNCHLVLKKKNLTKTKVSSVFSPLPAAPLPFLTKTPVEARVSRRLPSQLSSSLLTLLLQQLFLRLQTPQLRKFACTNSSVIHQTEHTNPFLLPKTETIFLVWW